MEVELPGAGRCSPFGSPREDVLEVCLKSRLERTRVHQVRALGLRRSEIGLELWHVGYSTAEQPNVILVICDQPVVIGDRGDGRLVIKREAFGKRKELVDGIGCLDIRPSGGRLRSE